MYCHSNLEQKSYLGRPIRPCQLEGQLHHCTVQLPPPNCFFSLISLSSRSPTLNSDKLLPITYVVSSWPGLAVEFLNKHGHQSCPSKYPPPSSSEVEAATNHQTKPSTRMSPGRISWCLRRRRRLINLRRRRWMSMDTRIIIFCCWSICSK